MSKFDEHAHRELSGLRGLFKEYWDRPDHAFGERRVPDTLVRRIEALEAERDEEISSLVEHWKKVSQGYPGLYYVEETCPTTPYGEQFVPDTMAITKIWLPLPPNNVEWRDLVLRHEAEKFLVRKWERRL